MRQQKRGGDLYTKLYGNHEPRIRNLELEASQGAGIDFNQPNTTDRFGASADYLMVETTGNGNPGGGDPAMTFIDTNNTYGGFQFIEDGNGSIDFQNNAGPTVTNQLPAPGGGYLDIDGATGVIGFRVLNNSESDIYIQNTASHGVIVIDNRGDDIEIATVGGCVVIRGEGGPINGPFTSANHALLVVAGGHKLFAVDVNGDLHGRTGHSLAFDL